MPQKSKRELVEPNAGDKRYIRRDDQGQIKREHGRLEVASPKTSARTPRRRSSQVRETAATSK